nr:MAG TPA_asm: HNH endonuclease [Caudoviricetes sp.]
MTTRDMKQVTVVTGPPAAGKTTHVREHAKPGDVIIDYDLIANALSGQDADNHDHPAHIQAVTKAARQAALDAAIKTNARTWLIHATPSPKQQANYSARGAEIITIDPGKEVVMRRIKAERLAHMAKAAGKWYADQASAKPKRKPAGTTERGYGWKHQQQRERLLRRHRDGAPCSHCGKPMYRDPARNFDGAPLEAQHADALANHEDKQRAPLASELMHRFCNRSLGDGTRSVTPPGQTPAPGGFDWQTLG